MKYLLLAIAHLNCLLATSITEISSYPEICNLAAKDDAAFSTFKQHPCYQGILEHVSYELGLEYLKVLELEFPFVLDRIENCQENDLYGNPKTHLYSAYGNISPTTLRYMKVAGELVTLFGDLKEKEIVEIGGGYGGQCLILHQISGFKKYTIIDLPEVSLLQKKYLNLLNVHNVEYLTNKSYKSNAQSYDLVISNYAFTEISRDEQQAYIKNVINKSRAGYITCNFVSDAYGIRSLSLREITNLIQLPNRRIRMIPENPVPAAYASNVILLWEEK